MDEGRRGVLFGFAAYSIWGLFPLYFPLLEPAGPVEILAHRCLWSLVVVLVALALTRRLRGLRSGLSRQQLGRLSLAAVAIAANWGLYIYAVNSGHVVEAALGYFINPLVSVLFGVVIFHERLPRLQVVAIGLAALAVVVITVGYGRVPWIALVLAGSFATYGLIKKTVGVPALEGLGVETGVLALPALTTVAVLIQRGDATVSQGPGHLLLLASTGLVTVVPLLFFAGSASRVPLSTLGIMQYLTPSLQFAVGVLVRHEDLPAERLAGFVLVWVGLALFTVSSLTQRRRTPLTRQPESLAAAR